MTTRLYYTDSYLAGFEATVTSVDGTRVYLDRTAFYPTSGGQPHDVGTLGSTPVLDVVDEESSVAHVVESAAAFAVGTSLLGTVDWPRRFDHMQQHTGQHLLSAVFEDLFGHRTVSVHFGAESSTLDLDVEVLPAERLVAAEHAANHAVLENRAVSVTFENAAVVTGLRKPPDRAGEIRIVSILGLDRSACGGTHVRATGEIGAVAIRRVEKFKKLTRVEFRCGWRALGRMRTDAESLARMAARLSTSIDELPALVEAQAESLRGAEAERKRTADALAAYRARELYASATIPGPGPRQIVDRTSSADELRALAQAFSRMERVVFVGVSRSPPAVVFAASEDSGLNAGALLKTAVSAHGGRGGGSPRVAQGTVADPSMLEAVVLELRAAIGA